MASLTVMHLVESGEGVRLNRKNYMRPWSRQRKSKSEKMMMSKRTRRKRRKRTGARKKQDEKRNRRQWKKEGHLKK